MYLPRHFAEEDVARMHALMRAHPFALLISTGEDGPEVSHLPMLPVAEPAPYGTLLAHFARANPHWKALDGRSVLVVFQGPQAYISPSHYASKREHGKVVPTWNYAAVHARGTARIVQDPDALHDLVSRLTDEHEGRRAEPWALSDAPESYVRTHLRGIVGIEIAIERLEGKWKMSQNRDAADREGVRAGLAEGNEDERAVAALVPPADN